MPQTEITYHQALRALQDTAKKEFEKEMRPDGRVTHLSVGWTGKRIYEDLPNVGIRLFVNGTWEYEDGTPAGGSDEAKEDDTSEDINT